MATYTLTQGSPASASYTLTASPLQVIISPASNLKQGQTISIEKETASSGVWIICQGEVTMIKEQAYSFQLKPANYRVRLNNATAESSVVVDVT